MSERQFTVSLMVDVQVTVTDPDVFERITGPGGGEWREQLYDYIKTEKDVLDHLAYNCVANGCEDARILDDGWADLPREAVHMQVAWCDGLSVEEKKLEAESK